ncbi:MAG: type II toxin-antitoxin system prevent-host-death family antitoxin [Synechococcus sp.]|nr:type II toxin-antitoxin system prevent-host-death family antitoxin [Synechococcus sp.]
MKTGPQRIQSTLQKESPHRPAAAVPLADAKNRLSALVDLVEQGEHVTISRRGVPVARLVPLADRNSAPAERVQRVEAAVEKLLQLRDGLVLEGDLQAIAREGLD